MPFRHAASLTKMGSTAPVRIENHLHPENGIETKRVRESLPRFAQQQTQSRRDADAFAQTVRERHSIIMQCNDTAKTCKRVEITFKQAFKLFCSIRVLSVRIAYFYFGKLFKKTRRLHVISARDLRASKPRASSLRSDGGHCGDGVQAARAGVRLRGGREVEGPFRVFPPGAAALQESPGEAQAFHGFSSKSDTFTCAPNF